jgi:nitrous oxide reductase accessory protein NosL
MRLLAVIMFGLMTAACNQEQDITGSTPVCAMRKYTSLNRRDMTQCVAACKACDHGNTVTCSTSCTLKGAH